LARHRVEKKPPLAPPDDSHYAGWETWTNNRWAWEFRRRDKEFVRACGRVADGKDDARMIAEKFHLRRFKHCDEPYESTDATSRKTKPAFILSSVLGTPAPLNETELREAYRTLQRLPLDIGQVVVRFDLSLAAQYPRRLQGQITSATKALKKQLERVQNATGMDGKWTRNRLPASRLLHLLKVLDMQKVDGTNVQRGDALFGNAHNATDTYNTDLKAARTFANENFLKLAAAGSKHPPKKV
jgi:hypothetical protein